MSYIVNAIKSLCTGVKATTEWRRKEEEEEEGKKWLMIGLDSGSKSKKAEQLLSGATTAKHYYAYVVYSFWLSIRTVTRAYNFCNFCSQP